MFKDGSDASRWVRDQILDGQGGTLAVAFWGKGAIEQLGLARRPTSRRINVICNLSMGGTNPFEVERLLTLDNVSVQQADKLHGKVYRFEHSALIGSANASANGLSFEGAELTGWHEAGLITSDSVELQAVDEWSAKLGAREIRLEDLQTAKDKWKNRRAVDLHNDDAASKLVEWLSSGSDFFEGRSVYLACYCEDELSDDAIDATSKAINLYGKKIDWYHDWQSLPKNGLLVSFWIGTKGKIRRIDGLYERHEDVKPIAVKNAEALELVFKAGGRKAVNANRQLWQRVITWFLQQPLDMTSKEGWDEESQSGFINLRQVAKTISHEEISFKGNLI